MYYPKNLPNTMEEIREWSNQSKSNLNEEELDEILEAIWQEKITIDIWLYFYCYQQGVDFIIIIGSYKDKSLYFQQREDWGVIYHSIVWEDKEGYILNLNGEWREEKEADGVE